MRWTFHARSMIHAVRSKKSRLWQNPENLIAGLSCPLLIEPTDNPCPERKVCQQAQNEIQDHHIESPGASRETAPALSFLTSQQVVQKQKENSTRQSCNRLGSARPQLPDRRFDSISEHRSSRQRRRDSILTRNRHFDGPSQIHVRELRQVSAAAHMNGAAKVGV